MNEQRAGIQHIFVYVYLFIANCSMQIRNIVFTIDQPRLIAIVWLFILSARRWRSIWRNAKKRSRLCSFFSLSRFNFQIGLGFFFVVVIFPLVFLFCFHVCSATSINQIKSKYAGLQSITNSNFDRVHTWMRAAPMSHRVSRMALCVHLALTIRHNFDLKSTQKMW